MEEELVLVFKMDGDRWSVHFQGFDNLQENAFGFGDTKKDALENLMEQLGPDLN